MSTRSFQSRRGQINLMGPRSRFRSSGSRPKRRPISRMVFSSRMSAAPTASISALVERVLLHAADRLTLHQLPQELDDGQYQLGDRFLDVFRLRVPSRRRAPASFRPGGRGGGALRRRSSSRRNCRSSAAVTGTASTARRERADGFDFLRRRGRLPALHRLDLARRRPARRRGRFARGSGITRSVAQRSADRRR